MAGINEVDRLKRRIKKIKKKIEEIQNGCGHHFQLQSKPKLVESLVPNVYVGKTEGRTRVGQPKTMIKLVCSKCSASKSSSILDTCPFCLVKMNQSACLGAGSRKKYFGEDFVYFSIIEDRCPKCGFTVASDEWDQ